jgi:hypothetical protein
MIYLLLPVRPSDPPFEPVLDRNYGFVVRADSEEQARSLADDLAKSEGAGTWLDPALTSCEPVDNGGPSVLLVRYVSRE